MNVHNQVHSGQLVINKSQLLPVVCWQKRPVAIRHVLILSCYNAKDTFSAVFLLAFLYLIILFKQLLKFFLVYEVYSGR